MPIDLNFTQKNMILLCAILTLLVGSTLFYSLWQWHTDWLFTHQPVPVTTQAAKTNETSLLIAAIPKEHLFGKSVANDVPITNLQFRVTGIVKSDNESSKAYISIANQPSKIVRTGDSLPYGVKVYAITKDAIILENEGRLEKLPLPREPLEFKPRHAEESL